MKWTFFDINRDVVAAMNKHLSIHGQVIHGSFENMKADAIVSPANSFGFMDGGIDLAYSKHFGWDMSKNLQQTIVDKWNGEIPVGMAEIVLTGSNDIKYLICAPTMRVPLHIGDSVNVYMAMCGIIRALKQNHPLISTVAVPGLGTGVGGMNPEVMAKQMALAIDGQRFPTSIGDALLLHDQLP